MAAQHKRPGRAAKVRRKERAREREPKKVDVILHFPSKWKRENKYPYDISQGKLVVWAEVREA